MKNNCDNCNELVSLTNAENIDPHEKVSTVYDALIEKYEEGKLKVLISDYRFRDLNEELRREGQFSYTAFLKCTECGRVFELGVCIRGIPVFRVYETEPDITDFKDSRMRNRRWVFSDTLKLY